MGKGKAVVSVLRGIIGKLVRPGKVRGSIRLPASTMRWRRKIVTRKSRISVAEARSRAQAAARHHASFAGPKANKTAAAVDRRTGQAFTGYNRDRPTLHPELERRLPARSETRWRVDNCAEVSAANKALNAGARFEDLVVETVHSRNLGREIPCINCKKWVP